MKKIVSILLILIAVFAIIIYVPRKEESEITPGKDSEAALDGIIQRKLAMIDEEGLDVRVSGKSLGSFGYDIRLDDMAEFYI